MNKLKFLFTASRASHIENFHIPAIKQLQKRGHSVDVVSEGIVSSDYCDHSYSFTFKKKIYSPKNFDTIRKLSRLINKEQYDIIVSNTTLAGIMTRLALPTLKRKRPYHIYICHGYLFKDDNSKKSSLYRIIEKSTASRVDLLLTMNKVDYEIAQRHNLCRNIRLINGMGVNVKHFPNLEQEQIDSFRSSIGASKEDFLFLCVGEFSERKNQKLIISAFSRFISKYPNSLLLFAGTGKLLDEAKRFAEYKEISHKVRFLGQITDTNILYRASQALISSSRSEGLPFNIMEALECGVPVIASDVKGNSDLIRDEFNGLIFSDNSEEGLLENMLKIMDKEKYITLCKNTYLDDKYKSDSVIDNLLKYYLSFDQASANSVKILEDNQ